MGAGYEVAPSALSGTVSALSAAADDVSGAVTGPSTPDAGIASGAMAGALAVLTGAGGVLGEALRSNAGRVSESMGGYQGIDDALGTLFGGS